MHVERLANVDPREVYAEYFFDEDMGCPQVGCPDKEAIHEILTFEYGDDDIPY